MRKEALYSYSKNFDIFNEPIQLLHVRSGKSIFLVEIHFGAAKMKRIRGICLARRYNSPLSTVDALVTKKFHSLVITSKPRNIYQGMNKRNMKLNERNIGNPMPDG